VLCDSVCSPLWASLVAVSPAISPSFIKQGAFMNKLRFAAALAFAAAAISAHAERVDLRFTGNVSVVMTPDVTDLSLGTPVTGRIAYDTDESGPFGVYLMSGPTVLEAQFGNYEVATPGMLAMVDAHGSSESIEFAGGAATINGQLERGTSLRLVLYKQLSPDESHVLSSEHLPNSLRLADFDEHSGVLFLDEDNQTGIGFELTSITAVPEPSALAAVLSGLAALVGVARLRRLSRERSV
jgi:hypothetical protein